jgi:hypothetical protein
MAWTTFAALGAGPATPDMLDGNYSILAVRAPVDCTCSGTNTLTLVPINGTTGLSTFQFGMQFSAIAAASNTGAATATVTGLTGSFPIYRDNLSGPVPLTGGEIVIGTLFTLFYDQALNGNAGGFHVVSVTADLTNNPTFTTVTATTVIATNGSISGLANINNENVTNTTITSASINFGNVGNLTINGRAVIPGSLQVSGGDFLVRFNSTLASIAYGTITANGETLSTVSFAGAALGDNVIVGQSSVNPAGVIVTGWVSAAGSIVLQAANATGGGVPAATLTVRVTDMGWAT